MSYQDDNNWQVISQDKVNEYLELAKGRISADYIRVNKFIRENKLSVDIVCPEDMVDYEQKVYNLAEEMWKVAGYYNPPQWFIRADEREKKLMKKLLEG